MSSREDNSMLWVALVTVVVFVVGAIAYRTHVENDCRDLGGHVKWIYGGKHQPDNYLCLSPDGRILG